MPSEARFTYMGHQIVVKRDDTGEDRFFIERRPGRMREINPRLSDHEADLRKYAGENR